MNSYLPHSLGNDEPDATGLTIHQENLHNTNHFLNLYLFFNTSFKSMYPEFFSYEKRYQTFLNSSYPHIKPSPEELAISGFFYKHFQDATQCYFCGHTLAEWTITDSPLDEHRRFSPSCKHVVKVMLNNGLLKHSDSEISGMYHEAKTRIEYLHNFCKNDYKPFFIAVQLGHNKDSIVHLLAKKLFLHDFTMANIESKDFISELIELQLNLDNEEQQQMSGIYDQLVSCINSRNSFSTMFTPSTSSMATTASVFSNQVAAVASNSNAMQLSRTRSQEELERFKKENSSMIVKSLCRICESTKADVIGLPCGHIARCASCWRRESSNVNCPICGESISESILVFRS